LSHLDTLDIDHSASNSSDPRLHSLSEIKATIILQITDRALASAFHLSGPFVLDVPVEVVEEGEQIETELYETLFLVPRQRPENFRRIVHVVFIPDPVDSKRSHGW
jgi:hypothetical protein